MYTGCLLVAVGQRVLVTTYIFNGLLSLPAEEVLIVTKELHSG